MPFLPFAHSSAAAPAKVNLGLHVLARRTDGFHRVESVLWPIGWADELRVAPAAVLRLSCSDPVLPTDRANLVVRAAEALAAWALRPATGHLYLDKRVPYGAGLGSGSSDAAATLHLLARLWGLDVPRNAMHAIAASLGSDVPFFLDGVPALATGRGEIVHPLMEAPRLPYALVVVVPPVHISTAEAYERVVPREGDRPDLPTLVGSLDLDRWQHELVNDFQAPIEASYPVVADARRALMRAGAGYAALSGSGSAVFGLFADSNAAQTAAEDAAKRGERTWIELPTG